MSIDVFYQPLDVSEIQQAVFPFIRGHADIDKLLARCADPASAIAVVQPLRNAYAAQVAGTRYDDPEWGRCDPEEYLADRCVSVVLEFCRHIWPYWWVKAITSIALLPEEFPVLDHYEMPLSLFQPFESDVPSLALNLETIADAQEIMGGIIPANHVRAVLQVISDGLASETRDPDEPSWYDASVELKKALTYAVEHGLSFTEAIE